jgi:hypothetical protein
MFQELQIFAFVCTYSDGGCLFRLGDSDFGIIPIDDITNGNHILLLLFLLSQAYSSW